MMGNKPEKLDFRYAYSSQVNSHHKKWELYFTQEISKLKQQIKDYADAYKSTMEEVCEESDDRKHCTCVPFLREEIEKLKAENERLKDLVIFTDGKYLKIKAHIERVGDVESILNIISQKSYQAVFGLPCIDAIMFIKLSEELSQHIKTIKDGE